MFIRKWIVLALMVFVMLPATAGAGEKKETPKTLPGVTVVDADVVKTWLDNGDDVVFLDARKTTDYQAGHLPDAIRATVPLELDVSEETIKKSMEALKKLADIQDLDLKQKIVTYCNGAT